MEGHCPDKLGGICDRGYHGLQGASRWFCKIYCGKAVIVGLIGDKLSKKYQILGDRRILLTSYTAISIIEDGILVLIFVLLYKYQNVL